MSWLGTRSCCHVFPAVKGCILSKINPSPLSYFLSGIWLAQWENKLIRYLYPCNLEIKVLRLGGICYSNPGSNLLFIVHPSIVSLHLCFWVLWVRNNEASPDSLRREYIFAHLKTGRAALATDAVTWNSWEKWARKPLVEAALQRTSLWNWTRKSWSIQNTQLSRQDV